MSDPDFQARFAREMMRIYERAKAECNYNPTRFLQMVTERGAIDAAHALLAGDSFSEGLTKLWEKKRLDLSLEALVLRDPWRQLFTDDELRTAERRLRELGYQA
jgi:hypothetical protein